MTRFLFLFLLVVPLILVACGGGRGEETSAIDSFEGDDTTIPFAAAIEPDFPPGAIGLEGTVPEFSTVVDAAGKAIDLNLAERQVISTASISLEVETVDTTVTNVRVLAESLGGFVEQMSVSGEPDQQVANLTIRVPQSQFFTALDQLSALGEVRSQNLSSQDVTEEFIDLEARLTSSLREEQSLLSLLDKAENVSDILTIERELSRIRTEIERFQGQLNFLENRVDLATIGVSLFTPQVDPSDPPSASLTIEASNVTSMVEKVKALVETVDGEADRVFVSVDDGMETAFMSLRVFVPDFELAIDTIENMGDVTSKKLEEGTNLKDTDVDLPEKPNARIDLSLVEKQGGWKVWLVAAIAGPIGGIALVLLLSLLFILTYRMGRRRVQSI